MNRPSRMRAPLTNSCSFRRWQGSTKKNWVHEDNIITRDTIKYYFLDRFSRLFPPIKNHYSEAEKHFDAESMLELVRNCCLKRGTPPGTTRLEDLDDEKEVETAPSLPSEQKQSLPANQPPSLSDSVPVSVSVPSTTPSISKPSPLDSFVAPMVPLAIRRGRRHMIPSNRYNPYLPK